MLHLYSAKSTGGQIIELLLHKSPLKFEVEFLDYEKISRNKKYLKVNPLHQFPALRLPGGAVMTESLAISTYLNAKADLGLIPAPSSALYPEFLRWSVFLVASIYPTFTYADDPSRWVKGAAAGAEMKASIISWRKGMWRQMEKTAAARGPWFLGSKRTLIDYYICVMLTWSPGPDWFKKNTPRLLAIRERMKKTPEYKAVYAQK